MVVVVVGTQKRARPWDVANRQTNAQTCARDPPRYMPRAAPERTPRTRPETCPDTRPDSSRKWSRITPGFFPHTLPDFTRIIARRDRPGFFPDFFCRNDFILKKNPGKIQVRPGKKIQACPATWHCVSGGYPCATPSGRRPVPAESGEDASRKGTGGEQRFHAASVGGTVPLPGHNV